MKCNIIAPGAVTRMAEGLEVWRTAAAKAGQTPAGPTFLVTGTLTAPRVAGASVDGVAACVVGSTFFVNAFTPQVSLTSFTAAANDYV